MELLIPNRILNDDTYKLYIAYATESKELSVVKCDGSIRYCDSNPQGKILRCKLCQYRVKKIAELTGQSIDFSSKEIPKVQLSKSLRFKFKNSALSILASQEAVSLEERLSKNAIKNLDNLVNSSQVLFLFLKNILLQVPNVSRLVVFNGRYPLSLATYLAAKEIDLDFRALELWGRKVPHGAQNRIIHDPKHIFESCYKSYQGLNSKDIDRISAAYYESRWKQGGGASGEKDFTSNQEIMLDNIFKSSDKVVKLAGFPSSNFEYNFLPEGYCAVHQENELKSLINQLAKYEFNTELVLRLHPNLKKSKSIELDGFNQLESLSNDFVSVRVVKPGDSLSTYQLMKEASHIVSFASFAAVEANYLGKKVIQIGPSRYRHFNISNIVDNGEEAAELLVMKKDEGKPRLGAKIFAAGFMIANKEFLSLANTFTKVRIGLLENLIQYFIKFITRYRI